MLAFRSILVLTIFGYCSKKDSVKVYAREHKFILINNGQIPNISETNIRCFGYNNETLGGYLSEKYDTPMISNSAASKMLRTLLIWFTGLIVTLTSIILVSQAGLLILSISPNPKHPPFDFTGESIGITIICFLIGAFCVIVAQSIGMPTNQSLVSKNKFALIGGIIGLSIALIIGLGLTIIQIESIDGQAVTSTGLAILFGLTIGLLSSLCGSTISAVMKHILLNLS